jgi:hypothetical protein
LFVVGNFLYGRWGYALALAMVFVISGLILLRVINTLWTAERKTAPDVEITEKISAG